jgi:hypothetical protein
VTSFGPAVGGKEDQQSAVFRERETSELESAEAEVEATRRTEAVLRTLCSEEWRCSASSVRPCAKPFTLTVTKSSVTI